ncbi:phage terminase large subunit family protein [Sphingomonas sp. CARO-RG-8B-R24-01]|uniref:phage terminase large subunit family protein n=1 Tax=Sphingomonas sp. CARO-RG-8B-R24-01 TaxID=2914831 RepID=UPI001F583EBC|nr:phage terminase large subunit family protein [Sphingomonas sp. CARO-RG-8B-R24-01]
MDHLPPETSVYADGTFRLADALADTRRRNLQPPPALTLSQWAARYAVLSAETSAQTGRFRAYAYQVGMMDAVTDPSVTRVTIMKSARVGYTKILDHVVGYYIHQDPSAMLVVQPRVEDAEDYSSTEIEPMLRDTPVLAEAVGDLKGKDAKQKLLKRVFRNGSSISFVGANSPGGFRRVTVRVVMFDEVDGYPVLGAGDDGDQIRLGERRAQTFWNRKIILGSTPLIKGESRIEKSYLRSDQRKFFVPCPQCGEHQVLEWGGPMMPYGMKWDRDAEGNGLPETAYYLCRNGCIIRDVDKPEMLDRGEWRASAPFTGHAGFHIWTGYSLDPNASWPALVAEWLEVAHDPLERKTFFNLVLGEPYEERGERALSEDKLLERCEVWASEVPDGVAVITFGADVQPDRVEIEHVGWGRNEESWSIAYKVFRGDPNEPEFWNDIDAYLKREWLRSDGRPFVVAGGCIDTGGANTQAVYNFVKPRFRRNIWGIKGASEIGGVRKPIWPPTLQLAKTRGKYTPVQVGTTSAKDSIRSRLHQEKPGSGYMHFPADRDRNYFAQLTAERLVDKKGRGRTYKVWECPKNRANEALDCRVYAFAALVALQQGGLALNRTADQVGAAYTIVEVSVPAEPIVTVDNDTGESISIVPDDPTTMLVKVGEAPKPAGPRRSLGSALAARMKR